MIFLFYLLYFLAEKQEQLKLILEKFMEDIHHHLLDCRSTLEGMETHQIELKGIMKKQSMATLYIFNKFLIDDCFIVVCFC